MGAPEHFELTASLVSTELDFCVALVFCYDFRAFGYAQCFDPSRRTQANLILKAVLVGSCLDSVAAIVWVERLGQLELVRALNYRQLHDYLELELGDLLGKKIAEFDFHDFLVICATLSQDSSVACCQCIIIFLLRFLFGSYLGLDCLPVDLGDQLGEQGRLFQWQLKGKLEGIVFPWVLVLQAEV